MHKNRFACIDLGSNDCRLRIMDDDGTILYFDSKSTKLAEGLSSTGCLSQASFERGLKAFQEFADWFESYHVTNYRAVATAACRTAKNGQEFINMIKQKTGITIETIDAVEEARLNAKGAMIHTPHEKKYAIIYDLGGASTEISLVRNDKTCLMIHTISIPLGARNATEKYDLEEFDAQKARLLSQDVAKQVHEFINHSHLSSVKDDCCLIATSSTPLRLCAMVQGDETYGREKYDGMHISCKDFNRVIDDILNMNLEQRIALPCLTQDRAKIFVAACIIFQTIYQTLGFDQMIVSYRGAQDAMLEELRHAQND